MPRGVAKVSEAKKLDIIQRRNKIARYIEMGERNQQRIKENLARDGYTVSSATITRDVQALQADYAADSKAKIENEKGISLRRIERYIRNLQPKVQEGDTKSIRLAKELEETRAKLLGLYMPAKIAHTNPEGDKEFSGIPDSFKQQYLGKKEEEIIVDAEVIQEIEGA